MFIFTQKEDLPKVTIVTVVYNLINAGREVYFRQCLESVHNQSYPYIEHLVIDGASDDGTIDLLEEYRKKGYVKYYSEPDEGLYDAMNKGIQKATGKYVAFLNSDDFYHNEDAVALSIEKLEEEQADFSCASAYILQNEERAFIIPPSLEKFFLNVPVNHQTVFMRREVLLSEGGFRKELFKICADYDLIVRVILKGYHPIVVDECIASYRYGGASINEHLLNQERRMVAKEFFSGLDIKFIKSIHGVKGYKEEYFVTKDQWQKLLDSNIHSSIKSEIAKMKVKERENTLQIYPSSGHAPLTIRFCLFGKCIFAIEKWNRKAEYNVITTFRLFSIKLWGKTKRRYKTVYKFLYLPIFSIKNK